MYTPVKDELVATQAWILDDGFQITRYHYGPLGTSSVELESDAIKLMFLRDRLGGRVFVELAPLGEKLWPLDLVLEAITGVSPSIEDPHLPETAWLLRENLPRLKQALGADWPQTKQQVEKLSEERLRPFLAEKPEPIKPYDPTTTVYTLWISLAFAAFLIVCWLLRNSFK
jgi:hypothetical protein